MRPELLRNQRQHLNHPWIQVHLTQHSQLTQVGLSQARQSIQRSQLIQVGLSQAHQVNQLIRRSQLIQVGRAKLSLAQVIAQLK